MALEPLKDSTVLVIGEARGVADEDAGSSRIRAIRSSANLWVPFGIFAMIALACFVWPEIYPVRAPIDGDLAFANLPPLSPHYLLGTDPLGNDILSRLLYGGRVSIEVGLGSNAIGMIIGALLGTSAGYLGGLAESGIMRALDMLLGFPPLVLSLVLVTYLGPSEIHVIWAISIFFIPAFARLARAATLRLRELNFVVASKLCGTPGWRIVLRHIVPNVLPQLMTFAFLGTAIAIIIEAALSFLGLGVPPPGPSWGNMISVGQTYLATNEYLVIIPSGCLFLTVLSLNLLGDALRVRWSGR